MLETAICIVLAKELIYNKIVTVSAEYGVSESVMDYVVRNESQYNNCAKGDFHVKKPSLGLSQINLHYNPETTPQEAYNASYALEYLASELRQGKCSKWTTCRAYMKKYPQATLLRPIAVM